MIRSRLHTSLLGASLGALAAFVSSQILSACHASHRHGGAPRAHEEEAEEEGEESKGEENVDIAKVPESVRAGAQKYFGDLHGCKASRESEHGAQIFEIVGKGEGGREVSLNISSAGSVFEVERELANDGLPPELRAAVEQKFGGAKIEKAEAIELHYFEVHLVKGGKTIEVKISGTGQIMEDEN